MLADDFRQRDSLKDILRALFSPIWILWLVASHVVDEYFFDGRFEKRYAQRLNDQFAAEIQERVPILFTDFGARIVPNTEDHPRAFDFAAVTVAVDRMLLLFTRSRGEFEVDVTPVEKPTGAWWEISSVVKKSDLAANADRKVDYYGLNDFGEFFQANFEILCQEVSKPDWRPPRGWLRPI